MKKIHESKNSKKFNATINKVHEEMEQVEDNLSTWNVNWKEKLSGAYCYDLQYLTEAEISELESLYCGKYDLTNAGDTTPRLGAALKRENLVDVYGEEYLCEFRKVEWLISNNKIGRIFVFENLGDISYSQVKRNRKDSDESYDYYAKFNVNDNTLSMRFTRCNEDFVVLLDGERRIINTDGLSYAETGEESELVVGDDNKRLIITIDSSNTADNKVLIDGNRTYVICGDEVIRATKNEIDDEEADLEITEELVEEVKKKLAELQIGTLSEDELLIVISSMKTRVSKAIRAIKNDVILEGLGRRLDIALAMINMRKPSNEEKALKKEKRI